MGTITIYDTTLRDGTQREGMSLSVEDKLRIASKLDAAGLGHSGLNAHCRKHPPHQNKVRG